MRLAAAWAQAFVGSVVQEPDALCEHLLCSFCSQFTVVWHTILSGCKRQPRPPHQLSQAHTESTYDCEGARGVLLTSQLAHCLLRRADDALPSPWSIAHAPDSRSSLDAHNARGDRR